MPISSFPPLAIMVNFYDDTNLNTEADVNNAYQILVQNQKFTNVKYLGLEITDETAGSTRNFRIWDKWQNFYSCRVAARSGRFTPTATSKFSPNRVLPHSDPSH